MTRCSRAWCIPLRRPATAHRHRPRALSRSAVVSWTSHKCARQSHGITVMQAIQELAHRKRSSSLRTADDGAGVRSGVRLEAGTVVSHGTFYRATRNIRPSGARSLGRSPADGSETSEPAAAVAVSSSCNQARRSVRLASAVRATDTAVNRASHRHGVCRDQRRPVGHRSVVVRGGRAQYLDGMRSVLSIRQTIGDFCRAVHRNFGRRGAQDAAAPYGHRNRRRRGAPAVRAVPPNETDHRGVVTCARTGRSASS